MEHRAAASWSQRPRGAAGRANGKRKSGASQVAQVEFQKLMMVVTGIWVLTERNLECQVSQVSHHVGKLMRSKNAKSRSLPGEGRSGQGPEESHRRESVAGGGKAACKEKDTGCGGEHRLLQGYQSPPRAHTRRTGSGDTQGQPASVQVPSLSASCVNLDTPPSVPQFSH